MEHYTQDITGRLVENRKGPAGSARRTGKCLVNVVVGVDGQAAQTQAVERPHCAVRFGDLPMLTLFTAMESGDGDVLMKVGKTSAAITSANTTSKKDRAAEFGKKVRVKGKAWVNPMNTTITASATSALKDGTQVLPGVATAEVGPDKPVAADPDRDPPPSAEDRQRVAHPTLGR